MRVFRFFALVVVLGGIVVGCSPKTTEPEPAAPPAASTTGAANTGGAPTAATYKNDGAAFGPDGKPLPK